MAEPTTDELVDAFMRIKTKPGDVSMMADEVVSAVQSCILELRQDHLGACKQAAERPSVLCFITGSRAYGAPRPGSDYDFVVALPVEIARVLEPFAGQGSDPPGSVSLRFNRLNLIIPTSKESLKVWQQGTQELCAKKPVTRDQAVEHFKKLRKAAGIID